MNASQPKRVAAGLGDFVAALFAGTTGYIECRALPSKARAFYHVAQLGRVVRFTEEHRHENVYVGMATRRDQNSGTLENCLQLAAVYADMDFKTQPEAEARARLERFPFQPSLVVRTGGGLHAHWLLREPSELPGDEAIARDALRRLAIALGADLSAAECARVLRLPGTFNYKYARRRAWSWKATRRTAATTCRSCSSTYRRKRRPAAAEKVASRASPCPRPPASGIDTSRSSAPAAA
jgi:hypothetical protein